MRGILRAGAGAVALVMSAAVANAADLTPVTPMVTKAPPYVAQQGFNWTGFYVGVNGGGGWGHAFETQSGGFGASGGMVGGTIGYNTQIGRWVLGFEGDIDWADVGGSTTSLGCAAGCNVQNNWLGTARGRVGYAFDRFMPYVTGGLAVGDVNATSTGFSGQDNTQVGWTAGAGFEYAFAPNWSAKLEYLHVDLGRFDCGLNCGVTTPDHVHFREDIVRAGVNLHF